MENKLVLGPILGLETENNYTVTFVVKEIINDAKVKFNNYVQNAEKIGEIYLGQVWRAEIKIQPINISQLINYTVFCDGNEYLNQQNSSVSNFYVAGQNEKPRFAYCTCNGFSDYKLFNKTDNHEYLWEKMKSEHEDHPFSVLLMGGDQIYADSIWESVDFFKDVWNYLNYKEKNEIPITESIKKILKNRIVKYIEKIGTSHMFLKCYQKYHPL